VPLILVLCLHEARLARGGSYCASTRPDWHVEALFAIHSFVCYQTCEQDILKTNKPILMHIGINGPQEKGMKWSTFGASRSEMKTTRDLTRFGSLVEASFLTPFGSSSFSSFINNLGKCRSCLIIFSVLRSVMDCGRSYHSTTWSQNFCLITSTTVPPGLKTCVLLPLPQYHLVSKLLPYHLYHSTIWSQNLCLITSQNLSVQLFVHVSWFEVRNYRVIFCLINLVSLLSIFVHAADVIMTSLQYSVTVPAKCLALY